MPGRARPCGEPPAPPETPTVETAEASAAEPAAAEEPVEAEEPVDEAPEAAANEAGDEQDRDDADAKVAARSDAAAERARAREAQRSSRERTRTRKRKPEPEPAPPPKPAAEPTSAEDLLRDAQRALAQGNARQAYKLARLSYGKARTNAASEVMTVAACKLGDRDRAKNALRQLPLLKRPSVRTRCLKLGVRI